MALDSVSAGLILNDEPLDPLSSINVPLNNLIDILLIHIAVPDRFGIDDQHRAFIATIQTAGAIDANIFPFGNRFALLFGIITQILCAMFATAV